MKHKPIETLWRGIFLSAIISAAAATAAAQGTISLSNLSYPYTAIEENNWVEVDIIGAAAYGTVSVVVNGNPPYVYGTADASGNWSIDSQETSPFIGAYAMTWYVNGTAVTPVSPPGYFGYAPKFPNFLVYAPSAPVTPPIAYGNFVSCGGPVDGITPTWVWSPVGYVTTSSYGGSVSDAAAASWNTAQSKVVLQSSIYDDILFEDSGSLPVTSFGGTYRESQACNTPCYGLLDLCNYSCFGSTALVLPLGTWTADWE